MISEKEKVCEIIDLWKMGEKGLARSLLMIYRPGLSEKIYIYLFNKMGIVRKEVIPKLLIEAQKIMGGKIFDQFDNEQKKEEKPRIEFGKKIPNNNQINLNL